jgi:hypothetical protein
MPAGSDRQALVLFQGGRKLRFRLRLCFSPFAAGNKSKGGKNKETGMPLH